MTRAFRTVQSRGRSRDCTHHEDDELGDDLLAWRNASRAYANITNVLITKTCHRLSKGMKSGYVNFFDMVGEGRLSLDRPRLRGAPMGVFLPHGQL